MSKYPRVLTHLTGWVIYGAINFLAVLPLQPSVSPLVLLGYKLGWAAAGAAASLPLYVIYQRLLRGNPSLAILITCAIGSSAVFAPVWLIIHRLAALPFRTGAALVDWTYVPRILADHFFVLLVWSGAILGMGIWSRGRDAERAASDSRAQLHEARLTLLRQQLNPHFLFNALASIRPLIDRDPRAAQAMVSRFADFLRAALQQSPAGLTPLASEINLARSYLEIERIRFSDAFSVRFDVQAETESLMVPGFLIHPLIENAVKHGSPREQGRFVVTITATTRGNTLEVEVANTGALGNGAVASGAGVDRERSFGIGLESIRQRLASLFPGRHRFHIRQDGNWVRAVIEIPMIPANA